MKPINITAFMLTFLLVSCLSIRTQDTAEINSPTTTLPTPSLTFTLDPSLTKTPAYISTKTPIPTKTFTPVPTERPDGDLISGTNFQERGDGGECIIKAVLQPYVHRAQLVVLELACMRGPPSYNSGYAPPQKVILHNDLAVYSAPEKYYNKKFDDAPCHFVFEFGKETITVTQLGMDFSCGFGHDVYASGVYQLIDPRPPILRC